MFYLILSVLVVVGYAIGNAFQGRTERKEHEQFERRMSTFKKTAIALEVDLDEVTVKSNKWQEESVIDNSKYGGYNQMIGRGDLNIETVQHHLNVIQCSVRYQGENIEVERHIDMEPTTLRMKLALKQKTILYVNPLNTTEYYLDMEFLSSD